MCINRKGHLSAAEKYCMCKLHIAVFVLQNFHHSVNVWVFSFLFLLCRGVARLRLNKVLMSDEEWVSLGHCLVDLKRIEPISWVRRLTGGSGIRTLDFHPGGSGAEWVQSCYYAWGKYSHAAAELQN